jgi:hypothetical protein
MRIRRAVLIAGLMPALLATAQASADTTIGALAAPTPVRTWGGIAVLSVSDSASGRYALAIQRGTGVPRALPGIAEAKQPFDADIGPGPDGAPVIVFVRCRTPTRCRLARTTIAGGTEIAISGSAGTDGFESAPTVWGGRLAFARRYSGGSERVYTRPLLAGRRVRSIRLPGVPARECDEVQGCRAVTDGTVAELELRGRTLAENVHVGLTTVGICGEGQARLVDVARRHSRLVTRTICGLSGSTLLGVSLTPRYLIYARTCPGDPAGCRNHAALIYRYRISSRRSELVPERDELTGFSARSDDEAIEVRAPQSAGGTCTNHVQGAHPACELVITSRLSFTTPAA